MNINGKELGLYYSVWAHISWNNYIVKNPQMSVAEAQLEKVMLMHKAWGKANKVPESKLVTKDDILALPNRYFNEIVALADAQEKADTEVSVEAVSKNATSTKAKGNG